MNSSVYSSPSYATVNVYPLNTCLIYTANNFGYPGPCTFNTPTGCTVEQTNDIENVNIPCYCSVPAH